MQKATFYERQSLELRTDQESNSKYWSVRSREMSFTYFEVPPYTSFDKHSHLPEQVTYVLSGELYFETDESVYCLKPGDVIVIPSYVEHRVWTNKVGSKAVDAWTPANEKY